MPDRRYRQKGYQDSARSSRSDAPSGGVPGRLEGGPRGRGSETNRAEVFRCKGCGEKNDPEFPPEALCRRCGAGRHRWVLGVCQVCAEHCRHLVVDSSWDTHDSGGTVTGEGERSCRTCGLRLGKVPLKGG